MNWNDRRYIKYLDTGYTAPFLQGLTYGYRYGEFHSKWSHEVLDDLERNALRLGYMLTDDEIIRYLESLNHEFLERMRESIYREMDNGLGPYLSGSIFNFIGRMMGEYIRYSNLKNTGRALDKFIKAYTKSADLPGYAPDRPEVSAAWKNIMRSIKSSIRSDRNLVDFADLMGSAMGMNCAASIARQEGLSGGY